MPHLDIAPLVFGEAGAIEREATRGLDDSRRLLALGGEAVELEGVLGGGEKVEGDHRGRGRFGVALADFQT